MNFERFPFIYKEQCQNNLDNNLSAIKTPYFSFFSFLVLIWTLF